MKLKYLLAASTALISATAIAAGNGNPAYKPAKGAQSQTQNGGAQAQQTMDAETVKRVQEALASQGYDPGPADGIVGPKTTEAVKRAQTDKGITPTGKLDQQTVAALSSGDSSSGSRSQGSTERAAEPQQPSAPSSESRSSESASSGSSAGGLSTQQPITGSTGSADAGSGSGSGSGAAK